MPLRIGFLGAGFIARHHRAMLAGAPIDHEVSWVYDPDHGRAERFARGDGVGPPMTVVDSVPALLDRVDAVYVCTPTAHHPDLVDAVADAGVAVFCEKPLGVDLAAASRVASRLRDLPHQVGLVLRDSPAFLLLRSLVTDAASGGAMSVVFRDDQYLPVQGIYDSTWRADPALAGTGTLLEHSIHDLDLLEWLLGPVADISCRTTSSHGLGPIEDVAVVTMRFRSGAIGSLVSVWHDVLERPSQRRVEVFCRTGTYVLEGDVFGPVRWQMSSPEGSTTGALEDHALLEELARRELRPRNPDHAFLEAVTAGTTGSPTADDALRAHVLCDAAYRSAAAGGTPQPVSAPGSPVDPATPVGAGPTTGDRAGN